MTFTKDAKNILEQLVRIRTTQPEGDEKDAVLFLQDIFRPYSSENKLDMRVIEHGSNRASLLVTLFGKNRLHSVAICGHLDTVGLDAGGVWRYSPFSAFFDGERIYGRGTADMKGGVTSIILAALSILDSNFKPECDVQLCFTADEEYGGLGATALCNSGALDRAREIIIVKPTNGRIGLAEKGALWLEVQAKGEIAHAAYPELGVNALEHIMDFARGISAALRKEGKYPLLGISSCTVTKLNGGECHNLIPDRAEASLDIRTSPSFCHAGLLERVRGIAKEQMKKNPNLVLEFKVKVDRPALGMDEKAPLVMRFMNIFKKLALPWGTMGISYFTDASIFVPKLGIPFVIYGPGDEGFFHQPDEYISISSVKQAAQVLEEYLRQAGS